MAFFSIELSGVLKKYADIYGCHVKEESIGSCWAVYYDEISISHISIHNWIFLWYGEYNTTPDFERVVSLLDAGYFEELWGNRGVLLAINRSANAVYLFNDCYGSFPVYFSEAGINNKPIVSDSLSDFYGEDIDWASFYQFLSLGYVFGDYSILRNVRRLKANSCLKLQFQNNTFSVSSRHLKNFWSPKNEGIERKKDNLIDVIRAESKGFGDVQIMMSGGWDSRLLLSVLESKEPTLFTHGDLESREIEIVTDIASVCGFDLVKQSFSDIKFGAKLFTSYLHDNDSAMFTHWSAAGIHAERNGLLLTAGTFGEVLGGHYGTLNSLPGNKKYASLLMHVLGLGIVFDRMLGLYSSDVVIKYLKMSSYRVFWLLNSDLFASLKLNHLIEESNDRLEEIFKNYEEQGMEDAQAMFERFYTEHRGGQYINLQLTNSVKKLFYRNIFTNRELVETVSSIPFSYRAHNKLNKMIINRLHPRLLDYPMASTLSNASRPLLIQEGSRALRKILERQPMLYSLYRKYSRYGDRNFGWNNFQGVVNEGFIKEISPLLSENLWDQEKIVKAIGGEKNSNMYPLFDMLSKAITLNHFYCNN